MKVCCRPSSIKVWLPKDTRRIIWNINLDDTILARSFKSLSMRVRRFDGIGKPFALK
jgi:hypothetical protein